MSHSDKALVSIVIPIHNRKDCVLKTLKNIQRNTYRPLELVLVDDGSEDNLENTLSEFCVLARSEDFRIKVLRQENHGASFARNVGVDHASGEYVQFLDSDDFIATDKFQLQVPLMKKQKAQLGLCDFTMVHVKSKRHIYCSNADGLRKVVRATASFGCGSPLLHRSLIDRLTWNTVLEKKQDVDYYLKAALTANEIAYVKKSLYTYIIDESDDFRISASYNLTKPVFRERIASLRGFDVPHHRAVFKKDAIKSLKWNWLKHALKLTLGTTKYRLPERTKVVMR